MSGIKPWVFRSLARVLYSYLFSNPVRIRARRVLWTAASQRHLLGPVFMGIFFLMGDSRLFSMSSIQKSWPWHWFFQLKVRTYSFCRQAKCWIFCYGVFRIFVRVRIACCSDSWKRVVILLAKASESHRMMNFDGKTGFGVGSWLWIELTEWCFDWHVLARVFRSEFMAFVLT